MTKKTSEKTVQVQLLVPRCTATESQNIGDIIDVGEVEAERMVDAGHGASVKTQKTTAALRAEAAKVEAKEAASAEKKAKAAEKAALKKAAAADKKREKAVKKPAGAEKAVK